MRIHVGCDHAAFEVMQEIVKHLTDAGHTVINHGPEAFDAVDDYPEFCLTAAEAMIADPDSLAIVAGGSGNGEQIAANKVIGVRAALAWNTETARLARQHNDANVLSVGARMHPLEEVLAIVDAFLEEPFSGDARHARRIGHVAFYEAEGIVLPSGTPMNANGPVLT